MRKQIEGSMAVAEGVRLCRPHVISAYPITPQTHIVEFLAQMQADGDLGANCQFVNVESEHSAASVCLGASATGARAFTATTSQGLLLMIEVLYNIAAMRLPVVLTCANRALSAPISIWNDQQDAVAARDTGWIMLFAEDNQEVLDMLIQAYRIGEQVALPVMVNMDGFVLTHAFEPVDIPDQAAVDAFLPPYQPAAYLDPAHPMTFGLLSEPDKYHETRYILARDVEKAAGVVHDVADEYYKRFGRYAGSLLDMYPMEDADTVVVAMGSVLGTIKDAVDEMRDEGQRVGVLKVRCFRPFPKKEIIEALRNVQRVAVLDKDVSLGSGGVLVGEVRDALYGSGVSPRVNGFVAGLGGRDITLDTVRQVVQITNERAADNEFVDLKWDLIPEEKR
jgi:pyruvate ferredoxin oxidoreductase alpha subunit